MARQVGPDEGLRTVYLRNGLVRAQGRRVTLYLDAALTTLADVRYLNGNVIANSIVYVDADSRIPTFQYPDGVDVVYGVVNGGPTIPLYARYDSRLDALQQAIIDIEVAGGAAVTGYGELRSDVDTLDVNVSTLTTQLSGKQNVLPAGTASQFLRGSDKTFVSVSKTDVGLANVDNTADSAKPISTAQQAALDVKAPVNNPTFTGTVSGVTKTHVGLGNVDNTADSAKPVSTAQQAALDTKAPTANPTFTGTVTGVSKTHVGLGNVDNTSDLNKPLSTATTTALGTKLDRAEIIRSTNIGVITTQPALTSGTHNIAMGQLAQNAVTDGASNIAIGRASQSLMTSGAANTAVGDGAQNKLTTANFSTGFGNNVQRDLTTGTANVAVGATAQQSLTTGSSNTAVGHRAQYGPNGLTANATTTGVQQTSVGYESGQADATASTGITTMGYRAVAAGTGSVALGQLTAVTGTGGTGVGPSATVSGAGGVAIGSGAQATATNATAIGMGVAATAAGAIAIGRDSAGSSATTAVQDEILLGTWKHSVKAAVVNGTVNVRAMRLPGDPDDTLSIIRAVATGLKHIYFPSGTYTVAPSVGVPLGSWTGVDGVFIDASRATINNSTSYTSSFTAIWSFDNCKNVRVEIGRYNGFVLPDPVTQFGYYGELFVRLVNGCDGAIIRGTVSNVRYGVQSGDYLDWNLGNCKNIDIKLRTFMVGYPIALYLCEGVRFDIDADDSHRAAYLAGCLDTTGTARWQDQWGPADTVLLITDAKTGTTTSRGCQNLDVASIDKGSTKFYVTSYCCAIATSWVNPNTLFENIKIRVYSKSTDTLSSRVGGFRIISGVTNLNYPEYSTFNWLSSIIIRNVKVSGIMDHSAQTTDGNVTGDISIRGYDYLKTPNSYPTIDNLVFEDLIIKSSSTVNKVPSLLAAPLLSGAGATFRRVYAPGTILNLETNATTPTTFEDCTFLRLEHTSTSATGTPQGTGNKTSVVNSTFTEYKNDRGLSNTIDAVNTSLAGASAVVQTRQFVTTLSGATTTLTNFIPANSIVLGVQGRVTQTITGATGFQVGVSGALTRYADLAATTAVGSTFTLANAVTEVSPRVYTADTSLLITAIGSNFSGGQLRVVLQYIAFSPPTA